MKKGNWYGFDVCVGCSKRLNDNQKMYRGGICIHCGHDGGSTVCSTIKVVVRKIKHYKWYQLFNRKKTYEGRDEFSKNWLS